MRNRIDVSLSKLYAMIGEREVVIMTLENQIFEMSEVIVRDKARIAELEEKNGKLEQPNNNDAV